MNKTQSSSSIAAPSSSITGSAGDRIKVAKSASTYKPQIMIEKPRDVATEDSDVGRRSSQKRQNRNYQKRIETTGEKQSERQIQEMMNLNDIDLGAVNIQTDAISFDKNAADPKSTTTHEYKKQKSHISFKSKSSKRSGGGIPMPPSIYGQTQKQKQPSYKDFKPDTLNVSLLKNEQQPDNINRLIQRDNARMAVNTSMEQASLLIPNFQESSPSQGLLIPSLPKIQKQTTGRNDKQKLNKESMMLNDPSNDGLLLQPGFVIQRGLTKQEEKKDQQDKDTLDQQSAQMNAKSIKSITRPSNVSGMASVISPDSQYQRDEDDPSNDSHSDFIKPSVYFDMLDQATEKSLGNRTDFKIDDSKTIVTVETQIQILDPNKKETNEKDSAPDSKSVKKDKSTTKTTSDKQSEKSGLNFKTSLPKKANAMSQMIKTGLKQTVAKSFVPQVKESKMFSSRAQRDVLSDKGGDPKSESPSGSAEHGISVTSLGDSKGGLKNLQYGLVSIQERQDEQQDMKAQELAGTSTKPAAGKPTNQATDKIQDADEISEVMTQSQYNVTQSQYNVTQSQYNDGKEDAYDAIKDLVKTTNVKKFTKKGKKSVSSKAKEKEAAEDVAWQPQRLMKFQMYAADFYQHLAGNGEYPDDPDKIGELLGQDDSVPHPRPNEDPNKNAQANVVKGSKYDEYRVKKKKPHPQSASQMVDQKDLPAETDDKAESDKESIPMPGLQRRQALPKSSSNNIKIELQEKDDEMKALQDQVAQLKDVIARQKEYQEQVMSSLPQTPTSPGKDNVISNNQGYIGQIHQPVYNIKIYQGTSPSRPSLEAPVSASQHAPSYFAMSKPSRPNSSNVYATGDASQTNDALQGRKKRPMTAAGLGANRTALPNQANQDQLTDQFQPQAIDFQVQERPISAATYQKRGGRNNQRNQHLTDGQISDYRFHQEKALTQFLEQIQSNQLDVPQVGQMPRDKQSLADMKEMVAVQKLISEGHNFHPRTNLGSTQGVQRTQSCYLNVFSKRNSKGIMPNTKYVQTNAGKTGYASIPNKSQKILQQAYKVESKTLTKQDPLGMSSEPMQSLKGCIFTEMVNLHKQKNRRKHAFVNRNQQKDTVNRHTKLKNQTLRKANHQNEDLFFSPIDEYIKNNFAETEQPNQPDPTVASENTSAKSGDSRDSVPALTGNSHILMERDFFEKKYQLEQNGKQLNLSETHFQPIFFAKSTEQLRNDVTAQQALKQYRIFVRPDDMHEELAKEPLMQMDIGESLQKRIEAQQKIDLEVYRSQKNRRDAPNLHRQGNILHDGKPMSGRQSTHESHRGLVQRRRKGHLEIGTKRKISRDSSQRKMMMYKLGSSTSNMRASMLVNPLSNQLGSGGKESKVASPFSVIPSSPSPLPLMMQESKSRAPLTDQQKSFVNRMAAKTQQRTRTMMREKIKSNNINNEPIDRDASSPDSGSLQKSKKSHLKKGSSIRSASSDDKSSNMFSIGKGSPAQSAAKLIKVKKMNKSQSTEKAGKAASGFRPFSASTGGGSYPIRTQQQVLTQSQRDEVTERLKKSNTPTYVQMNEKSMFRPKEHQSKQEKSIALSNKTEIIKEKPNKPPKKKLKSELSSDPAKVKKVTKTNLHNRRVTSSSDKQTYSQKTGTVTDRRTDNTGVVLGNKNIDSKMSETHTNTESDITIVTRKERVPQNINLQVVIPNLIQPIQLDLEEVKNYSDEGLRLKKDFSTEVQKSAPMVADQMVSSDDQTPMQATPNNVFSEKVNSDEDFTPMQMNQNNISVSVMPLDELMCSNTALPAQDNFTSTFKSKGTEGFDEINESGNYRKSGSFVQIMISTAEKPAGQNNLDTHSVDSKMQFLVEDSRESFKSSELSPLQNKNKLDAEVIDKATEVKTLQEFTAKAISLADPSRNELDVNKRVSHESGIMANQPKVPTLMIDQLEARQRQNSTKIAKPDGEDLLKSLNKIQKSKNPNTDRHVTKDLSNQDSQTSRNADANQEHALLVPVSSWQKAKLKLKNRIPSKDSASSIMTPMFPRDKRRGEQTPSAASHSDFSFAADINRSQIMGDIKGSLGSNQSKHHTKRQATNFLLPSMTSKKKSDSRTGSHNDGYHTSEGTSEDGQRRIGDNIDLLELGASDVNSRQDLAGTTPKSAQANVKPIFQVVEKR